MPHSNAYGMDEATMATTVGSNKSIVVSRRSRIALLLVTVFSAAIPSLELAIGASALVAIAAFGLAVRWTRGRDLPASLLTIRFGLGLFTLGVVGRVVESGLNDGVFVFPGYADVVLFPAFLITAWGMARAVMARHALAKTADLVDAAAVAVATITIAVSLSMPFLFSEVIRRNEQIGAIGYLTIELAFFAVIVVLLFGPSSSVRSTRWLAAAGFYATLFDTLVNILYAYEQTAAVDQMLRTLAFPITAYAISTSFVDYADFARPGSRSQRHRWGIYGLAYAGLALLMVFKPGPLEALGLILFGLVCSARLAVGHTIASRLTLLTTTQNEMAAQLADADSPEAALEAGAQACRQLLTENTPIQISSTAVAGSVGSDVDGIATIVSSQDTSLHIKVAGQPKPHQWTALSQVADLLSFAVQAVQARSERIHAMAEANWRALSGTDNELVFIIDDTGKVNTATPNAAKVLGHSPVGKRLDGLLGRSLEDLLTGTEREILFCDPENRWFAVTAQRSGSAEHVVTVRNATDRVTAEFVDPVTQLNNMAHFARHSRLQNATLILFRIDNFSRLNDSLGKHGADQLLATIGGRVADVFRGGIDEVWRGDGPTFVAVCRGSEHSSHWVAERRDRIGGPVDLDGRAPTRIGITTVVVPVVDEATVDTALHRADITLNGTSADELGIAQFTPEIEKEAQRRFRIEEALAAVDNPATAGFRAHYQPIIDAADGNIDRVEALLRWTHPTLGVIPPFEFIPAAERTGRVAMLDQFVMETACADLLDFSKVDPALSMQVNLSPVGLSPERIESIAEWVTANCPTPPRLTVEIIESAIGDEFEKLVPALQTLRDVGVGLSVDDYGTSESNFSRLTRLPLTQVKLAGLFATDVKPETVAKVIGTIHSMGYTCVVENVEEVHQADAMQAAGADFLQGWLISKDLPADKLIDFLATYSYSRVVT